MKSIIKKLRRVIISVFVLLLVITVGTKITQCPPHQPQDIQTIKGVWLTHVGNAVYTYTGRLDDVFHQLSRLNFNEVYLGVYNNGLSYKSKLGYGYRSREAYLPFFNPLNSAIHEAKRQGLKIYAWYEYGLMVHPQDSLALKHPDWLLAGGKIVNDFVWLNPSHPQVQQYFRDIFTELAYLYPKLDGIQLDDHWAIPVELGNYMQEITQLTAMVSNTVHKINPQWIVSLSPNPIGFAYRQYSQDWLNWVYQGYIDEVVVQVYRTTTEAVRNTLPYSGLPEASQYVPVAAGIYSGFNRRGLSMRSLTEVKQQIEAVKNQGYGYCLFTYEYTFGFLRLNKTETKESLFQN